ncbi:MAG: hypothetical protein NTV22_00440 [bacterium]|nr:hypothetical protein [bacterium]
MTKTLLFSTARAARRVGSVLFVVVSAGALCAGAATHYVDSLNGGGAAIPFTNWATAAVRIQDAVDVARDGEFILVTTGVYASGVQLTPGFALANRLVVTNALTIASVGGPAVTAIVGAREPGAILGLGSNAVRGVYLAGGATLAGFTVSNGATFAMGTNTGHSLFERSGGGIYLDVASISNCIIVQNACANYGGGIYGSNGAFVCATQISSNWAAYYGGGIYWPLNGMLRDSLISGNIVSNNDGGGVCAAGAGLISNCVISGNLCQKGGAGGVVTSFASVELINCLLRGNVCTLGRGGGMYLNAGGAVVNNCIFDGNAIYGSSYGGGAYINSGKVNNCLFVHNYAKACGGGLMTSNAKVNNCTIVSNRSDYVLGGGGVYLTGLQTVLRNTIVYHNSAAGGNTNWVFGTGGSQGSITCTFVCTLPAFVSEVDSTNYAQYGEGNITNDPQFVDFDGGNYRLVPGSPCINAGSNAYAIGAFDLDSTARIKQYIVDMGAYEAVPEPAGMLVPVVAVLAWFRRKMDARHPFCTKRFAPSCFYPRGITNTP